MLLAYFIYITGSFLEGFYNHDDITFSYVTKNAYDMLVIVIFILVLWRHYQKEARTCAFM